MTHDQNSNNQIPESLKECFTQKEWDKLTPSDKKLVLDTPLEVLKKMPEIRRQHKALKSSFDDLRVATKYLAFDLEATRRENEHLRNVLEQHGIDPSDPPPNNTSPGDSPPGMD